MIPKSNTELNPEQQKELEHKINEELSKLENNQPQMQLMPNQIAEQANALVLDKIFLVGEVTEENATQVCRQMLLINERNSLMESTDPIHMIINSPGGDLTAAWMICDLMDTIDCPVITYGFGIVASAGLIIFMNGNYGARFATRNTQFMSHRFSMITGGKHSDLIAHKLEIDRIHNRIVDHYKKCTALPKTQIYDNLLAEHDIWFNAAKAKKLNIVDNIMPIKKRHIIHARKNGK